MLLLSVLLISTGDEAWLHSTIINEQNGCIACICIAKAVVNQTVNNKNLGIHLTNYLYMMD